MFAYIVVQLLNIQRIPATEKIIQAVVVILELCVQQLYLYSFSLRYWNAMKQMANAMNKEITDKNSFLLNDRTWLDNSIVMERYRLGYSHSNSIRILGG